MKERTHLVLGAGAVGTTIARILANEGEKVLLASRHGIDPGIPGVGAVRVDATRPDEVRAAAAGSRTAYFAVQPAYTDWPAGFPPLVDGVLAGLGGTGTRLVMVDNLYMYGPTGGVPITEGLPYAATTRKGRARAAVAERLLAADRDGSVRVAIGRASDFFGPGAVDSVVGERFFGPLLAGKPVQLFGDPDVVHSYTYLPDFARALVELGRREEAFGRAWHVPTAPAVSTHRFLEMAAEAAGVPARPSRVSRLMLRLVGLAVPEAREMVEMAYEFEEPFVLDSSAFEAAFDRRPTPLEESIAATVAWWREERENVAA